jgi:hypothetical protein
MRLAPDALRFVLAQRLPGVIDVAGRSMEPTVDKGARVNVVGVPGAAPLAVGDVVLVATTNPAVLLLHRVMCVFEENGRGFVVHQGDARASSFGVCARADVLARMTSFAGDGGDARPAPAPERLGADVGARFRRRRVACEAFVVARLAACMLGVADRGVVRLCARAYRSLARALLG